MFEAVSVAIVFFSVALGFRLVRNETMHDEIRIGFDILFCVSLQNSI
jgi:hypothetical protein